MIDYTAERIKAIQVEIDNLNPPEEWAKLYKQIKGIKLFFSEYSWDELIRDVTLGLGWVQQWRENPKFKQYYKLMDQLDQLNILARKED